MRKNIFKLFAVLLVLALVLGVVVSCNGKKSTKDLETVNYTFRDVWTKGPLNWNPHAWELSNDREFMLYLQTPFVDVIMDRPGEWKYEYDAATAVTDITATFADKAKWGIPEDATAERVYQIDLNPAMKWETGEPIKADDYIESMKLCLDPKMKNYRSSTFVSGEAAICNAKGYFMNDLAGKPVYKKYDQDSPADAKIMFTLVDDVVFFGEAAKNYYKNAKHKDKFIADGVDLFEKYKGSDYFEVTNAAKADMLIIAKAFGDPNPEAWKEFCVYDTGEKHKETPWESVGLLKTGEYQLLYITAQPYAYFYMMTGAMGTPWLVHKSTYEKNMKTVEGLQATSYGTDLSNTVSFGPYKVASYEKDKQMRLVRNPYWGGYHDGKHDGEYMADAVVIDIIENHATVLQRFGQGLVDSVGLTADDLEKYKKSDRLYYADDTYTDRLIFATSKEALTARDNEKGSGKRIVMHYKDFRKALSLSIDREKYCREATSAFKPAYFLLNKLYHYDIANDPNSSYRNSFYAKKAVLELYDIAYTKDNIDAMYAKVTGRDIETAREYFKKAYEQAVADGVYKDGEEVPIEIMASPTELTPQHIKQQDLFQEFFDEGSKGTPFEGKIKVKYESGDEKRYANVAAGKNMAIKGAWGGAAFYPFRMIECYTNPGTMGGLNKINESNGWNPSKDKLKIRIEKADGTVVEEERTYEEWSNAIQSGGDYSAHAVEQLQILSALETGVLRTYQCIPLGTYTNASILSYKVDYQTEDYHIMYGFGGFKFMRFNYTDAEWEEYVKKNQGQLNYE